MTKRKRAPSLAVVKKTKSNVKRPNATVYDAVASRVNYEGMIQPGFEDKHGEFRCRSMRAVPADEVLARRKNAPEVIPYGEGVEDILPDSDLLIAIHQYASDFYAANGMGGVSYRSMDETALIGVGVLLEEVANSCLGKEGHLALIDEDEFGLVNPHAKRKRKISECSEKEREEVSKWKENGGRKGMGKEKRRPVESEVEELDEEELEVRAPKKRSSRKKKRKPVESEVEEGLEEAGGKGEAEEKEEGQQEETQTRRRRRTRSETKKHVEQEPVIEEEFGEQKAGDEGGDGSNSNGSIYSDENLQESDSG